MSFEVEGKMYRLFPTEQKSASFQAREFVLEIMDGNYAQYIKFQAVQDRCATLDRFSEGDQVKVAFDLRGREWNGKFLTNLNAWRIDAAGEGSAAAAPGKAQSSGGSDSFPSDPFPDYNSTPQQNPSLDDLPF